ncbi:MAG TPA: hypothetical protein VK206_17725, partial [Anaerolineales bacterium]|nr:hypothetical protein [Anaerolineales bacterium]
MKNIFKQLLERSLWFCLLAVVLAACSPAVPAPLPTVMPSATSVPETVSRDAQVQSVEVQTSPTDPPQVTAVVHGNLMESCATLGESQVQYASNTFQITVYVNSPAGIGCAQVTTPFETTILLDTKDLPAGSYTVIVNGVSAVFTLPVETAIPSPLPTTASNPVPTAAPGSLPCTDSAKFMADITIPDNMMVAPNTAFT